MIRNYFLPISIIFRQWILKVKNFNFGDSFYSVKLPVRGAYDKFPDFFRMGTFIDSTHMKL